MCHHSTCLQKPVSAARPTEQFRSSGVFEPVSHPCSSLYTRGSCHPPLLVVYLTYKVCHSWFHVTPFCFTPLCALPAPLGICGDNLWPQVTFLMEICLIISLNVFHQGNINSHSTSLRLLACLLSHTQCWCVCHILSLRVWTLAFIQSHHQLEVST